MVKRILEQEQALRVVLSSDRKTSHLIPTWQDIDVLTSINEALSPISCLTDILSGECYMTVSAIKPMIHLIESKLLKQRESDTQLTNDLRERIVQDLVARYENMERDQIVCEILKVSSFLDPRFKTKYAENLEDDEHEAEIREMKEKLSIECGVLASTSATTDVTEVSTVVELDAAAAVPPPAKKRRLKNLGSFFKGHQEMDSDDIPAISLEQRIHSEIDAYIGLPKLDLEDDPLLWWKAQTPSFPLLSNVVRKYLCLTATSAASERLFSTSGNIVTPLRTSLRPDKVNMLTFLAKNL